jgi:hypothetical protein
MYTSRNASEFIFKDKASEMGKSDLMGPKDVANKL